MLQLNRMFLIDIHLSLLAGVMKESTENVLIFVNVSMSKGCVCFYDLWLQVS